LSSPEVSEDSCTDGIDNDCDQLVDEEDPDCEEALAGDDDDAVGDDDDSSAGGDEGPGADDDDEPDRRGSGCDCMAEQAASGGSAVGLGWLTLLGLLGLTRRRRA